MKRRFLFPLLAVLLLQCSVTTKPLAKQPKTLGPTSGSLVIVGGGGMPKVIFDRFFEAAGGRDAQRAVVPTAGARPGYAETTSSGMMFKTPGATKSHLMHTPDPTAADEG